MTFPETGALRHRMRLERLSGVPDSGGGMIATWELVAEVWASLRPLDASERVEADSLAQTITHEIWLRYRSDVTAADRLVFGGRNFELRAVIDDGERHRFLKCLAVERTP
jgi:SPP1 family predicted phage head-tail adaptor